MMTQCIILPTERTSRVCAYCQIISKYLLKKSPKNKIKIKEFQTKTKNTCNTKQIKHKKLFVLNNYFSTKKSNISLK